MSYADQRMASKHKAPQASCIKICKPRGLSAPSAIGRVLFLPERLGLQFTNVDRRHNVVRERGGMQEIMQQIQGDHSCLMFDERFARDVRRLSVCSHLIGASIKTIGSCKRTYKEIKFVNTCASICYIGTVAEFPIRSHTSKTIICLRVM